MGKSREDKRYSHKRERQAATQALQGGHVRSISGDWGSPVPAQPPLPDDAEVKPRRTKGGGQKCKRNGGGPHQPVLGKKRQQGFRNGKPHFGWEWEWGHVYRCALCNKKLWNLK